MPKLLSTAYFPPVSYFAAIAQDMKGVVVPSQVFIESQENYQKQSYRNRCRFYGADGIQTLSFPIIHENGTHKHPIGETLIDYRKPWVQQHKKAIISAYRTSAFFEYYQDELFEILDSQKEKLIDLNTGLLNFFIEKTGLKAEVHLTESYSTGPSVNHHGQVIECEDLREAIHPKRENAILKELGLEKPYFQVFAQKHGFIKDLSIMDLLFNEGPDSILFLKKL